MSDTLITTEVREQVFLIGFNRPRKKNAFNPEMPRELSDALTTFEDDPAHRCAVIFAHGDAFTAGLDLMSVAPLITSQTPFWPDTNVDPWRMGARERTKPVVCAVQGLCLTLGIELMLASDVNVVADNARFAQIEVKRGIFPFGGATIRFAAAAGWGNAMRYLLTGDEFDAAEALRIGIAQEVVSEAQLLERAVQIAKTIAAQAPLAVQATLASARLSVREGPAAAAEKLMPELLRILKTEDVAEGLASFMERRDAKFTGR